MKGGKENVSVKHVKNEVPLKSGFLISLLPCADPHFGLPDAHRGATLRGIMPKFRIKHQSPDDPAVAYLCSTYAVGNTFFDETDKEMFKHFLYQSAEFSGIKIISYAILPDHLHVLGVIPKADGFLPDEEYLRRLKVRYPNPTPFAAAKIEAIEEIFRTQAPSATPLRERLQIRVEDISEFMKSFKQQSAIWYNREHRRYGALWPVRYTRTIIETGNLEALRLAAAHINLNPVRYQLADDPKDYRWSTFGEASAGCKNATDGLRFALEGAEKLPPKKVLAAYQELLYGTRSDPKNDKLTLAERMRKRMPWFSQGGVVGSRAFVQKHLDRPRGEKQKYVIQAKPFALDISTEWPDIYTMRTPL
jgi:hypothetical protein